MIDFKVPTLEELSETTGQDIEQLRKDRNSMKEFKIDENIIDESSMDIIDEKMKEVIESIAIEREKLLAMALHEGYDGVDVYMDTSLVTDYRDYFMGFEYEVWKDEPPTIERYGRGIQRYDFRMLDNQEKQILLARIGVIE